MSNRESIVAGLHPTAAEMENVHQSWREAMLAGNFEAAWRATDRIERPRREQARAGSFVHEPRHLLWNGDSFAGRNVLVRCNHGLGDTLQFARFLPRVHGVAAGVTVMAQPPLVRLLSAAPEFGRMVNGWTEQPPPHDLEIEIMELAYAFRVTAENLPNGVPYLPQSAGRAPAMLLNTGTLRVGIVWAASEWDTSRSIALEELTPLQRIARVKFYSLQQGSAAETCAQAPMRLEPLSPWTREVENAAAAMRALDLVITVDSMTAHLAGALGRPVWLLLQHAADWRWMRARSDSPWYPTMRIFRQPRPGDWTAVLEEVALHLG